MTPTPRRLLLKAAACTDATDHPQRGHRRTIPRTLRSVRSPDNRTAHRSATPLDTCAPGPRSRLSSLPSTRHASAAILDALVSFLEREGACVETRVCEFGKLMLLAGVVI